MKHKLRGSTGYSWCGEKWWYLRTDLVRQWRQTTCPQCLKSKNQYAKLKDGTVKVKTAVTPVPNMEKLRKFWDKQIKLDVSIDDLKD